MKVVFGIECLGRRAPAEPALAKPVKVHLTVWQEGNMLEVGVKCRHLLRKEMTDFRCKAAYSEGEDEMGNPVICPYAVGIPSSEHIVFAPSKK
jgi:hypothetical protein